jgi:phosphohistidine phosphatase
MDLFLMQHGEAMAETDDPARPLTMAGRAGVERVAVRAQAAGVRVDRCLHSGKLRAEQTVVQSVIASCPAFVRGEVWLGV